MFDADSLAPAAVGSEVVIHAATAIPLKTRPTSSDWEMNDRLRREGTQSLSTAAARIGVRQYLQQSITWLARPADESFFNEESEPNTDRITESAWDGERIAIEAGRRHGFKVGVIRCGMFYGPVSGYTKQSGELIRRRKFPIVGSGDAIWSLLHTEDAASAFVTVAENQRDGLWHVVDDCPVKARDFLTTFARLLKAPPPRRVPAWLARLIAGSTAVDFLTASTRTANDRFKQEFGWEPRYPSYLEGLEQIAAAWREENLSGAGR